MKNTIMLVAFLVVGLVSPFTFAIGNLRHIFNEPNIVGQDQFGSSVAIDGNYALIAAWGTDFFDSKGDKVHLFDTISGDLVHTFSDPSIAGNGEFGSSISLDNSHVLIGASSNGSSKSQVHLFDANTGNLIRTIYDPTQEDITGFGVSVAVEGNHLLIGGGKDSNSPNANERVSLFDATTGNFLQSFDNPLGGYIGFGNSVAISGNYALIGASQDNPNMNFSAGGQAHLFDITTGDLLQTFNEPTQSSGALFGWSIDVSDNHVLIGALNGGSNGIGQAHLYDATTGNLLHTFNDPTDTGSDGFGVSVNVDGNNVLVGAWEDRTNGSGVGQAYLFDATTGNLIHIFDDPTVTSFDFFGYSVAIEDNQVLIGAWGDKTNGFITGQAYLFDITVPEPSSLLLLASSTIIVSASRRRIAG